MKTKDKENSLGFWSAFFTTIFSLLLTASLLLLVLLLFIHAINENAILPAIGAISGDWLALFFDSWYSIVIGGAFVLIPILLIVLLNTRCARRIFLAIGCSGIVASILSVIVAANRMRALKLLSAEWQDVLINVTAAFKDFAVVCAIILIAIGMTCLSIHFCITAVKGGKYEKDT